MALSTSATTAVIVAGSSAGVFGIAILSPENPWFFLPVCIVCAIVGALLHAPDRNTTIPETLRSAAVRAIFGGLIGAATTHSDFVVEHFPTGAFVVGGLFSFAFSIYGKRVGEGVSKILPSLIIFIKNFLERK